MSVECYICSVCNPITSFKQCRILELIFKYSLSKQSISMALSQKKQHFEVSLHIFFNSCWLSHNKWWIFCFLPDLVKLSGLMLASGCAWYLGYVFADIIPEDTVSIAIQNLQNIGERPVIKGMWLYQLFFLIICLITVMRFVI